MVSVRRIAIAVGAVVLPAAAVIAALALHEHEDWFYRDDHAVSCVAGLLLLFGIVRRLRRYTPAIVTAFSVVFFILVFRMFEYWDPRSSEIARVLLEIVALAAVAWAVAGRPPLLRRLVGVVTVTVLTILLILVPFLAVMPLGNHWTPPSWNDPRHLRRLRPSQLCRGVTLFDPAIHSDAHAFIVRSTRNFRGEHRPMVLLVGEFTRGFEWLPPDALTHMLVDDRDPALDPCERAGRHPVWPRSDEPVREHPFYAPR
jgi:peptidoglycan/LPS O-acetylase OafA/YrhL